MDSVILESVNLNDLAYEEIKKRIISREFAPGQRLVDSQLATIFQISRTPIRDAMRRLTKEGLLTNTSSRGFYVFAPTLKDIDEIFSISGMIETEAAARIIRRLRENPSPRLEEELNILEKKASEVFPMEKKTAFKDLSRKAKVQYIWDYYRWHIIAAICLVAFVISMIVHYAAYRESVLDIVMVNTLNPYEESVSSTDEFFEQEGFTKKEEVTVDTSITFSDDDNYSTNYYSDQKLTLKLSVGGADVLFAPEFVFQQYADAGSLMPLTDYLTADELEQYKDMIVYATDSETGETLPCGLELNDNQWLSDYGYYTGTVCFGIAYAADNKENAVDFFHYVMN